MHGDHERIFLQPNCCADAHYGRQWCEHDVWGDDCEDHTPATEYVRADAIEAMQAQVRHLMNELQAHKDALAQVKGSSYD